MIELHFLKAKESGVWLKSEPILETFFQAAQRLSASSKEAETSDTVRSCSRDDAIKSDDGIAFDEGLDWSVRNGSWLGISLRKREMC